MWNVSRTGLEKLGGKTTVEINEMRAGSHLQTIILWMNSGSWKKPSALSFVPHWGSLQTASPSYAAERTIELGELMRNFPAPLSPQPVPGPHPGQPPLVGTSPLSSGRGRCVPLLKWRSDPAGAFSVDGTETVQSAQYTPGHRESGRHSWLPAYHMASWKTQSRQTNQSEEHVSVAQFHLRKVRSCLPQRLRTIWRTRSRKAVEQQAAVGA